MPDIQNSNQNSIQKSFSVGLRKLKILKSDFDNFQQKLQNLIGKIDEIEREENQKNHIRDFLRDSFYAATNEINTKGNQDLVIHNGHTNKSSVAVIIEAKRPSNKSEMITLENINAKAMQELVLYYLRERISEKNLEIKQIIATNVYEWFVFDAQDFEKHFAQNKDLVKQFEAFERGEMGGADTKFFYKEIANPHIEKIKSQLPFVHFDIRNYTISSQSKTTELYKLFSPYFLLKKTLGNDSNQLNKGFYHELLHIMGLAEKTDGGKKLIGRKTQNQNKGSLLENTIFKIESTDKLESLKNPSEYGQNRQEQVFNVALELVITWINRILFLKLLEGQLVGFNKSENYKFLTNDKLKSFDDLNELFFSVLAKVETKREDFLQAKFPFIPYLNSSLFEPTNLEKEIFGIDNLKSDLELEIYSATVLKNNHQKKQTTNLNNLEYLLTFLDSYDFGSQSGNDQEVIEQSKSIINASVLGLIFEKINGYKDGSFFTPGFITMYMAKATIQKAIITKFNQKYNLEIKDFDELKNFVGSPYQKEKLLEYNALINSLKIVDPAVGSGHFLVSCLNQIIVIKAELKVLTDSENIRIDSYDIAIENDELIITDSMGKLFSYNLNIKESQRIQQTLFLEKQKIIENCLFGVDINQNSVKICQLRLWIELLKNAYYFESNRLQTLPNIDINIKCGNSLVSRYSLDTPIKEILKAKSWNIESYKLAITDYQNADSKEQKKEFEKLINEIKQDFKTEIGYADPRLLKIQKYKHELADIKDELFEQTKQEKQIKEKQRILAKNDMQKLETELEDIKNNKIYNNSFEWRFEFPEVLNENGDFVGFDIVIGNPPYIGISNFGSSQKDYFKNNFIQTFVASGDIYGLFYEQGWNLLKTEGMLGFITSNKWMRAGYGDLIRGFFAKQTNPEILLDLGSGIFDNATVDSNILIFTKAQNQGKTKALKVDQEYFKTLDKELNIINFSSSTGWFLGSNSEFNLKHKIESAGKPLKDWDVKINYGIKTGLNEAFIIDEEKKNELIAKDPKSAEIIKPILRGRDIKRYGYNFAGLYLIATFPALNLNIDDYPGVRDYLLDFGKDRLEQLGNILLDSSKSRKKTGNKWFETQDQIAYFDDFGKDKIIYPVMCTVSSFCYDKKGVLCNDKGFIITGERLKYIIAVLNSSVKHSYLKQIGSPLGDIAVEYRKIYLDTFPIPLLNTPEKQTLAKQIEELVEQILEIKNTTTKDTPSTLDSGTLNDTGKNTPGKGSSQRLGGSNTTLLENKIDNLVFELYELNQEEINLILEK